MGDQLLQAAPEPAQVAAQRPVGARRRRRARPGLGRRVSALRGGSGPGQVSRARPWAPPPPRDPRRPPAHLHLCGFLSAAAPLPPPGRQASPAAGLQKTRRAAGMAGARDARPPPRRTADRFAERTLTSPRLPVVGMFTQRTARSLLKGWDFVAPPTTADLLSRGRPRPPRMSSEDG